MSAPSRHPIVITSEEGSVEGARRLTEHGARVLVSPLDADGMLNLEAVLRLLQEEGIRSVMVEGGASVITHFLRARLVDYCVITIAPKFIGGFKAVNGLCQSADQTPVSVRDCRYQALDGDLIAFGPLDQA